MWVKTVFGRPAGMLAEVMGIDQPSPYEVVLCGASRSRCCPAGSTSATLPAFDVARDADTVVVPVWSAWSARDAECWKRCVMPGRGADCVDLQRCLHSRPERACSTGRNGDNALAACRRVPPSLYSGTPRYRPALHVDDGQYTSAGDGCDGHVTPSWRWTAGRSRPTI